MVVSDLNFKICGVTYVGQLHIIYFYVIIMQHLTCRVSVIRMTNHRHSVESYAHPYQFHVIFFVVISYVNSFFSAACVSAHLVQ